MEIESRYLGQPGKAQTPYYTLGLHPWYLDDYSPVLTRDALALAASLQEVLAIGESGLDKMPQISQVNQEAAFLDSIQVAYQLHKPLIIHAVRAHFEVMNLLRTTSERPTHFVFHGFNKHPQLASALLQAGACLSFGAAILREGNAAEALKICPVSQFFLETDDARMPIEAIYERAAQLRGCSMRSLQDQMAGNFYHVFGIFVQ